jgi:hypothetical protein
VLAAGDPDTVWPVAALLRGESALVNLDRAGVGRMQATYEPPAVPLAAPLGSGPRHRP